MKRRFFKSEKGQTALEYTLLLAVSMVMGVTFYKKMNEYLLKDGTGVFAKSLKSLETKLNSDPTGRYRTFPHRRTR